MPERGGFAVLLLAITCGIFVAWKLLALSKRKKVNYERALKMSTMLIHLPPSTDDVQGGGRDERDVANEEISEAQVMYNIIASTVKKGIKNKFYGQLHFSFEIVACDGFIKYYAVVPSSCVEVIRQALNAAYPSVRIEEVDDPNFFSKTGGIDVVAGGELELKKEFCYPIATYEDTRRDASLGIINAMSTAKAGEGIGLQIMVRPTDGSWTKTSLGRVQDIKDGKKTSDSLNNFLYKLINGLGNLFVDVIQALWKPPELREQEKEQDKKPLTNLEQEAIQKIEEKTKLPGFEVLIRVVVSSENITRSEVLLNNIVSVFSQFDSQSMNGFRFNTQNHKEELVKNYILRIFPQVRRSMILNSMEMASVFHLPSQNSIPTSQVERQSTRQVDGPAKLMDQGVVLGVNEFRGEQKVIRLGTKDRRRHTYVIGATGMGKSILLTNIAYQDMMDGRGFAFIDPHGDAVELLLSKVPPERMDDVVLFEPGNLDRPVGMNMFEFNNPDEKDFIIQESLNMLQSLYDPGNQGIFGPRAQHMFRNAALLLMSDPEGGTFIDIPRCFIDPEFVKSKLKYVTDSTVFDYWTKEFPNSQKSNDAGEVISWFVSKWGPFLSNKMMRNILGQTKSGFNIRKMMDDKKILLINLSKGKTGELNAKLLGMIFVMKFQAAAMSRADTPEDERQDFCLFVDEFQNFATESFESILSEARKYRLNLVLANQFMTQLTDKIREAILGNVGTIMSGRLGVTDAELMEKAFSPVFNAEDLHKMANYSAIATVMMYDMPSSPFTMKLLPPMGDSDMGLMERMKTYVLSKYGRARKEVEAEIEARISTQKPASAAAPAGAAAPTGAPVAGGAAKMPTIVATATTSSEKNTTAASKPATPTPATRSGATGDARVQSAVQRFLQRQEAKRAAQATTTSDGNSVTEEKASPKPAAESTKSAAEPVKPAPVMPATQPTKPVSTTPAAPAPVNSWAATAEQNMANATKAEQAVVMRKTADEAVTFKIDHNRSEEAVRQKEAAIANKTEAAAVETVDDDADGNLVVAQSRVEQNDDGDVVLRWR